MASPLVWLPADALAFRCPVEAVGTLRPDVEVIDAAPLSGDLAKRMGVWALAQLARIAQGDDRAAVEACRVLLDRCPVQTTEAPSDEWPEWMTARRLAYAVESTQ